MRKLQLPEEVRLRAVSLGDIGRQWIDALDELVHAVAEDWSLQVGSVLSGGSASLVVDALSADGAPVVLKLGLPETDNQRAEAEVLRAADGRGYVRLFAYDPLRAAMLMEKLGPPIEALDLSAERQLEIVAETLCRAWRPADPGQRWMTGSQKADWLIDFIDRSWHSDPQSCGRRVIDQATAFANDRKAEFDPDESVLVHGDAHPANVLTDVGHDRDWQCKLIDPDGLLADKAYDLGVLMREWNDDVLLANPLRVGRERCRRLSELTGVAPEPIWQWGLIERVSSGLLMKQLGIDGGQQLLDVAACWATGTAGC